MEYNSEIQNKVMPLQAADCAVESLCSCRDNEGRLYYV